MGVEIAWLKKSSFELSSWPSTYICTYFLSWILSTLAEIFEELETGCVDWEHLVPHRVQLQALVNRIMNFWLHTRSKISYPAGCERASHEQQNNCAQNSLLVRTLWGDWSTVKHSCLLYIKLTAAEVHMCLCMLCVYNIYQGYWKVSGRMI